MEAPTTPSCAATRVLGAGAKDRYATELGDDPGAVLLKRARVALTQGLPFGPGGQGHARMNVACPAAVLTAAVERIAAFLAESGES